MKRVLFFAIVLAGCGKGSHDTSTGPSKESAPPAPTGWKSVHGDHPSMPTPLVGKLRFGMPLDEATASWVGMIDDEFASKLAGFGLIEPRRRQKLGEFLNGYVAGRVDIKPATRTRIDFGFALGSMKAAGRLIDTGGFAKQDRITQRIEIKVLSDIDDEVRHWFKVAYNLDA